MGLLPDVGKFVGCHTVVVESKKPFLSFGAKVLNLLCCDVVQTYCFAWLQLRDTFFQLFQVKRSCKSWVLAVLPTIEFGSLSDFPVASAIQKQLVSNLVCSNFGLARRCLWITSELANG